MSWPGPQGAQGPPGETREDRWILLTCAEDFAEHLKWLVAARWNSDERDTSFPASYPCFVMSGFFDGGDSKDSFIHEYLYPEEVLRMTRELEPFKPLLVARELMG